MPDEPSINSMILDKLQDLRDHVNDRFDGMDDRIDVRFNGVDDRLTRIEGQTTKTNGRVTVLEQARARAGGIAFAFKWVPPFVTTMLGAGFTILIMALSGGIH